MSHHSINLSLFQYKILVKCTHVIIVVCIRFLSFKTFNSCFFWLIFYNMIEDCWKHGSCIYYFSINLSFLFICLRMVIIFLTSLSLTLVDFRSYFWLLWRQFRYAGFMVDQLQLYKLFNYYVLNSLFTFKAQNGSNRTLSSC